MSKTVLIEVHEGSSGPSLAVMDDGGGYRLAGSKAWGGGRTLHSFEVDLDELIREAKNHAKEEGNDI